ncbi:hypothetical protein [Solibacillus sp. CAU 1738]|uniref:hypothetical protein n=1 Tax=Solibacillus sp. CAU 1738 TaxID=3140363 RepID=UPI003261C29F
MNYNDLISNLQKQVLQTNDEVKEKTRLKQVKQATTEKHLDEQFECICAAFYAVEKDIQQGTGIEKPLLKRTYIRARDEFTFFTGHQFMLSRIANLIEDDPIFTKLHIEIPYDLKSKAEMLDGIKLEDCHLLLKYDFDAKIFVWKDESTDAEISVETLKAYIASVLNIRLLNNANAF